MSESDKNLNTKAFVKFQSENTKPIIFVVTDVYRMGIDNPDIGLVIQWDIFLSFDLMIQQMGRARRKKGALSFMLLTPK